MDFFDLLMFFTCFFCLLSTTSSKATKQPALGRPFELGALYNLKDDALIIPGPKLWTEEKLAKSAKTMQRKSRFEILTSDSLANAQTHFGINSETSLSILGGSIKVSGSAKYLNDRLETSNIARVSLKYDTRTFTRKLKPAVMKTIDNPAALEKAPGTTHAIVGIDYGATAVFVFDRKVSEDEEKSEVEESMKAAIKAIPGLSLETPADVESAAKKFETEKLSCSFYGDFGVEKLPKTYQDAVKVYKLLTKLLGKDYENSVPMTVWLFPLDAMPIGRGKITLHRITESLVQKVTEQIDNLHTLEVECNDLLAYVPNYHKGVRKNIEAFKTNVESFSARLKKTLGLLLSDARGTGNETALDAMLANKEKSTFSRVNLDEWMKDAKDEVGVLLNTRRLPNHCKSNSDFIAMLRNKVRLTLVLTMRLDSGENDFLNAMQSHLKSSKAIQPGKKNSQWWKNEALMSDLRKKTNSFSEFQLLEERKKPQMRSSDIQFLVREAKAVNSRQTVSIELYEETRLLDPDFEIPSAPGIPEKEEAFNGAITIQWSEPGEGVRNIVFYEIETFLVDRRDDNYVRVRKHQTEGGRHQTSTARRSFIVSGLIPEQMYVFQVSVISAIGKTAVGKQSRFVETTPCPKGTYLKNDKCISCKPGMYAKQEGQRFCLPCPKGTISLFGSSECEDCPEGTFSDSPGSTVCQKCPAGTFSDAAASQKCRKCSPGTFNKLFGRKDCADCPLGTFNGDEGSRICIPCPKGEFSDSIASLSCQKCPRGTYGDSIGRHQCQQCPGKTTTLNSGAVDETECGEGLADKVRQMVDAALNDVLNGEGGVLTKIETISKVQSKIRDSLDFHYEDWKTSAVLIQNHDFRDESAFKDKLWGDYKNGFGKPFSAGFWIGLDEMHRLTGKGRWSVVYEVVWDKTCNERGSVIGPDPRSGSTGKLEMNDFKVASEAENYRVSIGKIMRRENWGGNRTDDKVSYYESLIDGRPFSTKDNDNDNNKINCAARWGGGWWFKKKSCHNSCLNCVSGQRLYDGDRRIPAKSAIWIRKLE